MAARKRKPKQAGGAIPWHPYLNAYPNRRWLVFAEIEHVERAIDLLWTDVLRAMPHGTPDGMSLLVPADAVTYFELAGIPFEERALDEVDVKGKNKIES